MSKVGDYVREAVFVAMIASYPLAVVAVELAGGLQIYFSIKASHPNPPIYRDVNGDGVDDKIVQRKVERQGFLWTRYDTLENDVLFGIYMNGKKLYLPKDQFEECQ